MKMYHQHIETLDITQNITLVNLYKELAATYASVIKLLPIPPYAFVGHFEHVKTQIYNF